MLGEDIYQLGESYGIGADKPWRRNILLKAIENLHRLLSYYFARMLKADTWNNCLNVEAEF